ncbi:hypothetical protein KDH83_06130 [Achromobacter sp. Marseille-Q0513]|uniref:hypothetical protein n=1 Tax=Achromobacter sp. Marseille-Q0513 TaxID=2829161 RepID=UPI001B93C01D|nr:hypothetical protein [Achromobacter sp. Marseille-Q0513]MBR8652888.1 hypothetical protein [Achromobacter sp. Marseille-Q0513]
MIVTAFRKTRIDMGQATWKSRLWEPIRGIMLVGPEKSQARQRVARTRGKRRAQRLRE